MPDPNTVVTGSYNRVVGTFATLPPATGPQQGSELFISDCTLDPLVNFGANAVGGGTIQARVRSNGTVWKVA